MDTRQFLSAYKRTGSIKSALAEIGRTEQELFIARVKKPKFDYAVVSTTHWLKTGEHLLPGNKPGVLDRYEGEFC